MTTSSSTAHHSATAIGIDLGGTTITVARIGPAGEIEERLERPSPVGDEQAMGVPLLLAQRLLAPSVKAIGLGIAGMIDPSGTLIWGPNVDGTEIPYRRTFQSTFDLPTVVENDANCAAIAESRLGAGRDCQSLLLLTLGTGIGAGIVIGNDLYRGTGFAGELGHIRYDRTGSECTCGRFGCWEVFVSGRRLDAMAIQIARDNPKGAVVGMAGDDEPNAAHLGRAAAQGDSQALAAIEEVGGGLGVGLAAMVAVLDPEVIVIGGAVSELGDLLLQPTRRALGQELLQSRHRSSVPIKKAQFGRNSGVIGAAILAQEAANGR